MKGDCPVLCDVYRSEFCVKGDCPVLCDVYRSEFCVKQEDVSALFDWKCAIVYGIGEVQQIRRF